VTTEDDFHKLLDENFDDHTTRLVFADWLQDRGDPRADGYRALGARGIRPFVCDAVDDADRCKPAERTCFYGNTAKSRNSAYLEAYLPEDWFERFAFVDGIHLMGHKYWIWIPTRRRTEDAAALAFTFLPLERRAELVRVPELVFSGGDPL
jgi:uncharacterized protein (TIGR02996 family)